MARQYKTLLTMSAVAIALTSLLSACHQTDQNKAPKPMPVVHKQPAPAPVVHQAPAPAPVVHQAPAPKPAPVVHQAPAPKPAPAPIAQQAPAPKPAPVFAAPKSHYIFVIDAAKGNLTDNGNHSYTLTVPVNAVNQVADFVITNNQAPHYLAGNQAQNMWSSEPSNLFANTHAVISAKHNNPHAVTLTGDSVQNNNLVFNINTNKPFNGSHLKNIVLNIRGHH